MQSVLNPSSPIQHQPTQPFYQPTYSMHPEETCHLLAPNNQTYDPISNWSIQKQTTTTIPNHSGKATRLSNIDDLLCEQDRQNFKFCLETQRVREEQINRENPRFANSLKYSLKPEYNNFNAKGKTIIHNKTRQKEHEVPVSQVPIISNFS